MYRSLIITIFFILLASVAHTQNLSVRVQPNPVVSGKNFQVEFSLNGQIKSFKPPSFSPFKLISGPYRLSNMTETNGKMLQRSSFTYVLRAEKAGSYIINPASAETDKTIINSNSTKVIVLTPAEAENEKRKQEALANKNLSEQAEEIIKSNLFIQVNLNKSMAYVGEQLIASFKIFVNPELNLVKLESAEIPMFQGFWRQEIDLGKQTSQTEYVNGKIFNTQVFKKVILLPQQYGSLTIDPWAFESVVRLRVNSQKRPRDIFEEFFGNNNVKDFSYKVSSPKTTIQVSALPKGAPASFNGAVGKYSIDAWLDKKETTTDNPVTFKVKIEGQGNLSLLTAPNLSFPPGIESYEPKEADNVSINANGITGNKIYEYILMPKTQGSYKINPVEFTYFDLSKKEYVTLSNSELLLNVKKGTGSSDNLSSRAKQELKYLGKDIRFIMKNRNLFKDSSSFYLSPLFFISLIIPITTIIFFIFLKKKKDKEESLGLYGMSRAAVKLANKRLAIAKKYMLENKLEKFYEEVSRALWDYISFKLAIPQADLSRENVNNILQNKGVDEIHRIKYLSIIESCEYARYAPSKERIEPAQVYNEAAGAITKIEEEIRL